MLTAVLMVLAMVGAEDAPSDAEVLRALKPATRGLPFVVGEFRDGIVIVKDRREHKAVGPAVMASRWECTAYYTRTIQLGFPFGATLKKDCVSVVYIDKQNLKAGAGK